MAPGHALPDLLTHEDWSGGKEQMRRMRISEVLWIGLCVGKYGFILRIR